MSLGPEKATNKDEYLQSNLDAPTVTQHQQANHLARHWLPQWHPISGLDGALDRGSVAGLEPPTSSPVRKEDARTEIDHRAELWRGPDADLGE